MRARLLASRVRPVRTVQQRDEARALRGHQQVRADEGVARARRRAGVQPAASPGTTRCRCRPDTSSTAQPRVLPRPCLVSVDRPVQRASGCGSADRPARPPSYSSSTSSPGGALTSTSRAGGERVEREAAERAPRARPPRGRGSSERRRRCSSSTRFPAPAGPPFDDPRLHLQETQVDVEGGRPVARLQQPARPTSRSARRRRPPAAPGGSEHAELPAHLVLRRRRAVRVEQVALVEHGVRDLAARSDRCWSGGHDACTSAGAGRSEQPAIAWSQEVSPRGSPVARRARRWCRGRAGSSRCPGSRGPSGRCQTATGSR